MLWLSLLACNPPPGALTVVGEVPTVEPSVPTSNESQVPQPDPLRGFSWVVPGLLAAMPLPRDLDVIGAEGVATLVSLTEHAPDTAGLESAGMRGAHLPIPDFTAPTLQQMYDFVAIVEAAELEGSPVGVHCQAGKGRTGTMSAAWFVYTGETAEEALAHIRQLRPGSVETLSQEQALVLFEDSLRD